nr:MAG TPA: hypothetical protein [Bacteriophage sp.]
MPALGFKVPVCFPVPLKKVFPASTLSAVALASKQYQYPILFRFDSVRVFAKRDKFEDIGNAPLVVFDQFFFAFAI